MKQKYAVAENDMWSEWDPKCGRMAEVLASQGISP
jgi:hypothetical protein